MSDTPDTPSEPPDEMPEEQETSTPEVVLGTRIQARFWWSLTTLICFVAAVIALFEGYTGYALVAFAVAVSAAINLR